MGLLDWLAGRTPQKQREPTVESFEVRAVPENVEHNGYEFEILDIQAKGTLPVGRKKRGCTIIAHLFDITNEKPMPIFSHMEGAFEEETGAFEAAIDIGEISPGTYLKDWVSLFPVVLEALDFPFRGRRNIAIVSHLIPTNNRPLFDFGFCVGDAGNILAKSEVLAHWHSTEAGYVELTQNRDKTQEITVQLAFYIAASDRHLDPEEANVIKKWGKNKLSHLNHENKEGKKKQLNEIISRAYRLAAGHKLDLSYIVAEMNEIASDRDKYDAIELCLDVMSADGVAEPAELKELDRLAAMLKIDRGKFRALQDRRLTQVKNIHCEEDSLDRLVGITPDMDINAIKKHLTTEYRKWNSRSSSSDAQIREKAQEMLLLIGRARNFHLNLGRNHSSSPSTPSPKQQRSASKSPTPNQKHNSLNFKQGDQGVMIRWISKTGKVNTRTFHMASQISEVGPFIQKIILTEAEKDTIKRSFVTWDKVKGWG